MRRRHRLAVRPRGDGRPHAEAERLIPRHERGKLAPSRIMGAIYQTLLETMQADGFQVFQSRYRLGTARKSAILLRHWLSG